MAGVHLILTHTVHDTLTRVTTPAPGPGLDTTLVTLQLRVDSKVGDNIVTAVSPHAVLRC